MSTDLTKGYQLKMLMKNKSTLLKLRKHVKFLFFVTTWGEKIKQKPFIYFKYYESLLKIGRIGLTFGTGRKRVRYGILQR